MILCMAVLKLNDIFHHSDNFRVSKMQNQAEMRSNSGESSAHIFIISKTIVQFQRIGTVHQKEFYRMEKTVD